MIMQYRNIAEVAEGLREFGSAVRHDWSTYSLDGRSVKLQMNAMADLLEPNAPMVSMTAIRMVLGICPNGGGHWNQYCDNEYTICKTDEEQKIEGNHTGERSELAGNSSWH